MARQAIQNANASLYLPTGSYSSSTVIAGLSAGFTFACWFKVSTINAICRIMTNSESASAIATMGINGASGNSALRAGYYDGGSYLGAKSSSMLSPGRWYHGTYTFNGTNGNMYINGVLDNASTNSPSGNNTTSLRIGDGTSGVRGNVLQALVYNRALTAAEVASIYAGTIPTSGLQANYPLSEGAGSIAYDTSGNGNNGTITSGTWSRDTPTKTRKAVNGNMVYNGDFEIVPPFTATTTTQFRWIDGTAAGGQSAVNPNPLSWGLNTVTGTAGANYDTSIKRSGVASMKITAGAAGSATEVKQRVNATHLSSTPVLPSTSYTLSGWVKTSISTGTATTGAYLGAVEQSFSYSNGVARTAASGIVTTQDWTYYTTTFTTASTARYLNVYMGISSDGAGTLVGDAWFDDITLTPTTPITRTAATGRSVATGRSLA